MKLSRVGIDLAKNVFQLHGVDRREVDAVEAIEAEIVDALEGQRVGETMRLEELHALLDPLQDVDPLPGIGEFAGARGSGDRAHHVAERR